MFEELHSLFVSFLQRYDLVREEQNISHIFSSEREYFRDGSFKNNDYSNTYKEKSSFSAKIKLDLRH